AGYSNNSQIPFEQRRFAQVIGTLTAVPLTIACLSRTFAGSFADLDPITLAMVGWSVPHFLRYEIACDLYHLVVLEQRCGFRKIKILRPFLNQLQDTPTIQTPRFNRFTILGKG